MANIKLMEDPKTTKIQLEQTDWNELEVLSRATRTSINEHMRRAIRKYLDKQTPKRTTDQPQAA